MDKIEAAIKEMEEVHEMRTRNSADGYCEECYCWCLCHPCEHTKT